MNQLKRYYKILVFVIFSELFIFSATAQTFPTKPIRIIVPYPPGGSMDLIARLLSEPLAKILGQTVVVENRPGAAGQIATAQAAKADPDGHTLLLTNPGPGAIAFAINPKLSYNPTRDFSPISLAAAMPMVITVSANSRFQSISDLINAAKAQPGKLNFATTGNGALSHVVIELFNNAASIVAVGVPYKGGTEITTAMVAGDVDYFAAPPSDVMPLIQAGKLRALATTGSTRSPLMPTIKTVAELGLASFEVVYWMGLVAPAKTPQPIIQILNKAIVQALSTKEIQQKMTGFMAQASSSSPEEFQMMIQSDVIKWMQVVKASNIKIE